MICGLTDGQRVHLSTMADHAPSGGADHARVVTRFQRWLQHDANTLDGWFLPVAEALPANLPSSRCFWCWTAVASGVAVSP